MLKTLATCLAFCSVALCLPTTLRAQANSLACYDNSGNVAMELPVSSVYFDVPYGEQRFYTVTTPLSYLNYVLAHEYPTQTFYYCDFTPSVGTYGYFATIADSSATIDAANQYVSVTFNYTILQLGPDGSSSSAKVPTAGKTPTAEEKSKALAAYLAHVPKPVLTKPVVETPAAK